MESKSLSLTAMLARSMPSPLLTNRCAGENGVITREKYREIIDRSMSINTNGLVCLIIMLGNVMIVGGLIKAFHLCVCVRVYG